MSADVNALSLSLVFSYVERRRPGSRREIVAGLGYSEAQLGSPTTWIGWDTYAEIHRRVRALFPDEPSLFVDVGRSMAQGDAFGFIRTMGSLLMNAPSVYSLTQRVVPQFMFRCVRIEYRRVGPGEIEMVYRLRPGLEPLPGFFEIVHGILEALPRVIGGEPAAVEMSAVEDGCEGHAVRYRIRLAPSRSLPRRLAAVLGNYLRYYPRATRELEDANRRLQDQYDQLQKSYDEIARYRARLEAMVDERTAQISLANRSLEQTVSRLEDLDRAKNEMFANVSHELRTPLTMILGPVSTLLDGGAGPLAAGQRDLLRIVDGHSLRLLRQVNNLLDLAKLEAGQMRLRFEAVDAVDLAERLVASVRAAATARGLAVEFSPPPPLDEIHVDAEQLDKALLNVIGNAIKFTPPGGRIRVRVDDTSGFVRIAVSDTGPGIPPEARELVFERFRQVDGSATRRHGGTGIGLALARQIVALHAGHIDLESEVGRGSTFTVWLPKGIGHVTADVADRRTQDLEVPVKRRVTDAELMRVEDVLSDVNAVHVADIAGGAPGGEAEREPAAGEVEPAARAGLPTALVVDDDADVRRYLALALGGRFSVRQAGNGLEALESAGRSPPDVVVSDVMMPGIDGVELVRRLRGNPSTERVPVVLLTARADPDSRIRGLDAGADDYVTKPFSSRELVARLSNVVLLRSFERDLACRNEELARTLVELRRAQAELVQRAKMASLGQLVAGVAHELNNPVNFLSGATHIIEEKLEAAAADAPLATDTLATVRRMAKIARTGAERVAGIVTALRQFAGGAPTAVTDVDLEQGIRLTLLLLDPAIREAKVDVDVDIGGPLHVPGNAGELNQVLMNLLVNALKAARGGRVSVSGRALDGKVVVTVRDTGPGIPPDVLPRIFEPFFTTREPGEGTGLGLAISDTIVRAHGGMIEVESRPGEGAEFRFALPALRAAEVAR